MDTQGGFLHEIPVFLPRGMSTTGLSSALLPWLSPSYSGVVGVTTGTPAEPVVAVTFEWPMSWLRTLQEIPKIEREILCIRRFSADQALARRVHAFSNVQPGTNPPDTTVTTDKGTLGVESTSFTIENRRGVYSLFRRLRQRILEQDPVAFAKLAGYMIYVWFEDPHRSGLAMPFRKNDDQAVVDLLQELSNYEPQAEQMRVPPGPLPKQGPTPPVVTTAKGAKFYAVPLQASAPSTMLFTFTGFELGLAYTSLITAKTAWDEIQRLVNEHDKAGVDILLITAASPDQRGDIYPAEEAIANFALDNALGLSRKPDNIKQVWFHSWMTGRATALYPRVEPMFGPLYQSFVPLHHPLMASVNESSGEARGELRLGGLPGAARRPAGSGVGIVAGRGA
jgi:hypothetical protein